MSEGASGKVYDVVVVGSGVCGALVAWQLALRGCAVLLLEAGEEGPDRVELVGRYAAAVSPNPSTPYETAEDFAHAPSPVQFDDYYVQAGPDIYKSTYERRVGGSTWHWLGNVPRLIPSDFRMKSAYGVGVDWPLTYEELEPFYTQAEAALGASGDHDEWNGLLGARRSAPFPMTKVWPSYSDQKIVDWLGDTVFDDIPIRVRSTPQARNSQPYDGRPPCAGNSICVPICPIQAKYDATVHVKKAQDAHAELRSQAVVTRLTTADSSNAVGSLVYRTWDGAEHRIQAKAFVLAAHAIETAKLLLMSGLANSSDQVGRNLMDHLESSLVALAPEPVFPFRGPPTTSGIDAFRDGPGRSQQAAFRMSLGNDGWARIEPPAATLTRLVTGGLFGTQLREELRRIVSRQVRISYSTEVLPDPNNRVELSDQMDQSGLPRPKITFTESDYNKQAFAYAQRVIWHIFTTIGAEQITVQPGYSGAGHIMGTCRMGPDPATSVVDSTGRSHDHPNLFVVGSALFPTVGTANPTLTAAALSLRSVDSIASAVGEVPG